MEGLAQLGRHARQQPHEQPLLVTRRNAARAGEDLAGERSKVKGKRMGDSGGG